ADPAGALRHIGALTAGVSRRAAIQRTLLPLLLEWFADAPDPDAGLLAFRQVSDALGQSPWYLRLLRDDMTVAQRMARLLASSRYAAGLLLRQPETVAWLGNDAQLAPRERAALHAEAAALVGRHGEAAAAVAALRAPRCQERTSRRRPRRRMPRPRSCARCWPGLARSRPCSSTPACARKDGRGRWCAPWPPTRPTTSAGQLHGKARPCCVPSRWRATANWEPASRCWRTSSAI